MSELRFSGTFESVTSTGPYRRAATALALCSTLVLALTVGRDTLTGWALISFVLYYGGMMFAIPGLLGLPWPGTRARTRPPTVTIDGRNHVRIDRLRLRRAKLLGATLRTRGDAASVTLHQRDGAMTLVGGAATVQELVAALDLPSGTAFTLQTMRPPLVVALLALLVPLFVVLTRWGLEPRINVLLSAFVSLGLPLAAAMLPWCSKVTVGSDGVEVRSLLSRRFIRIDEVHEVARENERVALVLQSGERVEVMRPATFRKPGPTHIREAESIATRIEQARKSHEERVRAHAPANVVHVARGARSASEWVTALRALGAGRAAYRDGAASPDALASLLDDPGASDDVRLGAAVALRVSGDPIAVRQIRVAAAATAKPDLRGALEGVLDAGEDALEERVGKMRILRSDER